MVQEHNFDCGVDTDDKRGIYIKNRIGEENRFFSEEANDNENGHILEETSENDNA